MTLSSPQSVVRRLPIRWSSSSRFQTRVIGTTRVTVFPARITTMTAAREVPSASLHMLQITRVSGITCAPLLPTLRLRPRPLTLHAAQGAQRLCEVFTR